MDVVLVVDDEKVNRAILAGWVKKLGFEVQEYGSGRAAVRAFERISSSGGPLAAVIMDINMPDMDGLEAAWRIREFEACQRSSCCCQDAVVPASPPSDDSKQEGRALPYSQGSIAEIEFLCERCRTSRTPIWAVSSCSLTDQARSPAMKYIPASQSGPPWKVAGFDAFILKPIQPVQLSSMLSVVKRQGSGESSTTSQCTNAELGEALLASRALNTAPSCKLDACQDSPRIKDVSQLHSAETELSALN